jgi:hypothetical protein
MVSLETGAYQSAHLKVAQPILQTLLINILVGKAVTISSDCSSHLGLAPCLAHKYKASSK